MMGIMSCVDCLRLLNTPQELKYPTHEKELLAIHCVCIEDLACLFRRTTLYCNHWSPSFPTIHYHSRKPIQVTSALTWHPSELWWLHHSIPTRQGEHCCCRCPVLKRTWSTWNFFSKDWPPLPLLATSENRPITIPLNTLSSGRDMNSVMQLGNQ